LGKAAQQVKLEQTNPLDFIRPILIPAGYSPIENDDPYGENEEGVDDHQSDENT
jgi:hypothetical protein